MSTLNYIGVSKGKKTPVLYTAGCGCCGDMVDATRKDMLLAIREARAYLKKLEALLAKI
jgi:hypothetical protein